MQIALLVTPNLLPIPKELDTHSFGPLSIIVPMKGFPKIVVGEHMIVGGDAEAIKNWLRPFDGVWVGKGVPMLQQFEIGHIKD